MAILSICAASTGLTLTAASCVVFAELAWTPSIMSQAEDRAHRIGQKNAVNIYYLHGKGTLDDSIYALLHEKSLITTGVTDGRKVDLNLKHAEKQFLDKSLMKDGTMTLPKEEVVPKKINQSEQQETTIDNFFNKRPHLVKKRTKTSKTQLVISEEIENDDSEADDLEIIYDKETYNPQARNKEQQQLTTFKF